MGGEPSTRSSRAAPATQGRSVGVSCSTRASRDSSAHMPAERESLTLADSCGAICCCCLREGNRKRVQLETLRITQPHHDARMARMRELKLQMLQHSSAEQRAAAKRAATHAGCMEEIEAAIGKLTCKASDHTEAHPAAQEECIFCRTH
jgi:hypothetical protein